jgi:hypothetical protein
MSALQIKIIFTSTTGSWYILVKQNTTLPVKELVPVCSEGCSLLVVYLWASFITIMDYTSMWGCYINGNLF